MSQFSEQEKNQLNIDTKPLRDFKWRKIILFFRRI